MMLCLADKQGVFIQEGGTAGAELEPHESRPGSANNRTKLTGNTYWFLVTCHTPDILTIILYM